MIESDKNQLEIETFAAARSQPSMEARFKYLDQVCAENPDLRQTVEELLQVFDCNRSFLQSPPDLLASDASSNVLDEVPGVTIGSYKILETLGQGGMGNVYMAEQVEPVFRKVALKIIKSGMDSKSVIARFDAERQALARMDHPNIAKFYDAGLTAAQSPSGKRSFDGGRPYFVMELIKGRPITEYCQQHKLSWREKLGLFSQVCLGVQHAHQKGIIHRDLKPSNVLVARYDDRPIAKIIDFGVAKAIGEKLTDKTMFTRFGQLVGTLEYMSPEQAQLNQLDVDTRTDVYSLGAILYELLTDTRPFEKERLSSAALEDVLRMLREDEPDKPSTRLSKLSAIKTDPQVTAGRCAAKYDKSLPSELDWIVMKCLAKDRSDRYATINAVVQDIRNFLDNQPIAAGPPTLRYRMKKFLHRNKVAVSVATVIFTILLVGITLSSWLAIRASIAEAKANRAVAKLNVTLTDLTREKEESETKQIRLAEFRNFVIETFRDDPSVACRILWTDRGYDVAVQSDGKTLVAGLVSKDQYQRHQDMMVARYNSDLTFDTTFGNGGLATADFGPASRDYGMVMKLQSDGRILVAGVGFDYTDFPTLKKYRIVARFNSDGSVGAQYQDTEIFGGTTGYTDVIEQPDGKIVLLSNEKSTENKFDVVLTRLNADFTLDIGFGDHGKVTHDVNNGDPNVGRAMLQLADGRLFVAGSSNYQGYFVVFDADGTPVGIEGTIDTSRTGNNQFMYAALDASGHIYMAGHSAAESTGDFEIAVVRSDTNGALDTSYGDNGVFRFNESLEDDYATGVVVDSAGNLIVGGHSGISNYFLSITPQATLDAEFAEHGIAPLRPNATLRRIAVDGADRLLGVGQFLGDSGSVDTWIFQLNR